MITGGAGYIGSHAAKMLSTRGFNVIVVDDLSTGHASAVRWGRLLRGNVGDVAWLRHILQTTQVEAVLHFAASCYVGESFSATSKYYNNNVVNTVRLLDAVTEARVPYFVLSSSCTVYGDAEPAPITEAHPTRPVSPYGETKLAAERALEWYGKAYGLRWAALRYFNAAGADPEGELGEAHDPETHLVPLVIETALGVRPRFDVFGADYATADGTAVRDFVHVTDLADAHLRALQYLQAGNGSLAMNLGSGQGHSVLDVIAATERLSRSRVPVRFGARRAGDPPALVADASLAARVLGWRPTLSNLDSIVGSALRWHESQLSRRMPPATLPQHHRQAALR